MVPAGRLALGSQIEDMHQPAMMYLAELEASCDRTISEPTIAGNLNANEENVWPRVSV
jgi:hypothetical protein